ncbi:MAG: GPW/gp25 family protein [Melioribacteraceae bacterium]|nr:GPW/gp25 family protein [Melioribacteraceae bacterium]
MNSDNNIEEKSFLGTGWDFPPTFTSNGKLLSIISDEDDIRSSLEILLSTRIGERIMQPTYGCDLSKLLFEPIDASLVAYLKDLINDAILYHEPRIILNDVSVDAASDVEGKVYITIDYTIATTNTRYNYVYPFYKNEASNISK